MYSNFQNSIYNNAFQSYNSTTNTFINYSIQSQFKDNYLGQINQTGLISNIIYTNFTYYFNLVNTVLDPLLSAWNYLSVKNTKASIAAILTTTADSTLNLSKSINSTLNNLGKAFYVFFLYNIATLIYKFN